MTCINTNLSIFTGLIISVHQRVTHSGQWEKLTDRDEVNVEHCTKAKAAPAN